MNKKELMDKFKITITYTEIGRIEQVQREDITGLVLIDIAGDKHAYACSECGCIFQSKNMHSRNLFDTNDTKTDNCNNSGHDYSKLIQICECEPIV